MDLFLLEAVANAGGAIGAGLGAVGGSWLGGKGGEYIGEKAGQVKNWAGGLVDSAKNIFSTGTAGTLFGSDKFSVSGSEGEPLDVSKAQYNKIEELVTAGKTEDAQKLISSIQETKRVQAAEKAGTKPLITPPAAPQTGNLVAKQSGDNEQAKLDSGKGGGGTAVVSAPTINNNSTVQNTPVKLPPRNTDSTVNKYMQSRWAF